MQKSVYFGKNLDYLLKINKIQQSELAVLTNKSRACVSSWIHKNVIPPIEIISFLTDYFSVTTDELFFIELDKDENDNLKYLINKFLKSYTVKKQFNITPTKETFDDFYNLLKIIYKNRP